MKNILHPILLLVFAQINLQAQTTCMMLKINFADTLVVKKYAPEQNNFKYEQLPINVGDYRIKNSTLAHQVNFENITQVDLVYTEYPVYEDFTELNRKRIIELYMECPNAFNKQIVKWNLVVQTGAKKGADLQNYFHGFVVYYRPLTPFTVESAYFNNILNKKETLKDSTLLKVFARNTSWKDMMCVADVTGSMAPYTVQLLVWAKLNQNLKTFKQFVLFNDDDEKSNTQNLALDTFGIWNIETYDADKLMKKMLYAMSKGKHIENDLEAIFYAIKKFPKNSKNIVLIADNWEDPCDMNLLPMLKNLHIPIRVVVCGVDKIFNQKYLEIAYATSGSIHTLEDDITEMAKLSEGDVIKISGLKLKLQSGKFVQL